MRRCVCAFGCCCLACSPSLSLPSSNLCLPLYPLLSQDPLKYRVFPLSLVSLFLFVFVSASMSIRVFPAACSICSLPLGSSLFRWLSPPPLACCRWLSLVVTK
ncbi:hypothetical protein GQ42DRAFT_162560 [Ramicandelaber brevisporus]|nr:hypothetical protein GQ42DRAFT_162560 [Ramicandelaber brevisporus]